MTPITDAERKLQTQINLLTTSNEVLAEKLAAAETAHATELAAYELTVENLTAERAELQARVNQQASMNAAIDVFRLFMMLILIAVPIVFLLKPKKKAA